MAEGIFGAFTSAQKAGQEFGQAIQSKNILQEAYAGASPDVAADPQEQSTILQKASVLAGQKGLQSLAHSFQKDASSLSQDVQKSQINAIKNMQGQLGYSGQLLSALPADATTEDFNNVFANIKEPQAQMAIQSITRNPNFTPERKKELLTNLTKTVDQNLKAMQMTALGEYRERSLDIREEGILSRERTAAANQANKETAEEKRAAKVDDKFRSEVHDIERDFDRQRTRISQDPFMKPKDKQKALDDIDEREEKRKSESKQRYYPEHKEETQSPPSEKPVAKPAETKPSETKPTATKEDKDVYVVPGTDIGYVKPKSMTDKQWEDWKKNEAPKNNKGIEKKLPSSTAIKDYADKYFGGNVDKALEYLKKQGYK